ncbi:MAG: hypothetical protein WCE75_16105 [Terracidiphilus sp.]
MIARILRFAGFLLFAAAFALPAIRVPQQDPGQVPGQDTQPGWVCAAFATAANGGLSHIADAGAKGADPVAAVALVLSGWVNPLLLLYLFLCLWPRVVRVRRVLAVFLLVCIAASWVFFVRAGFTPLIGHFLWVAGVLIALSPEVLGRWLDRKATAPAA